MRKLIDEIKDSLKNDSRETIINLLDMVRANGSNTNDSKAMIMACKEIIG